MRPSTSVSSGGFSQPSLTSGTILGLLMNLLVLWIAGRAIESELGAWRFVALYLAAGLGGATMLFVFGPPGAGGYGAAAAVIGLLAANAIFKYKRREDVRADIGLFVLLILYSILIGFRSFGWLMLIGGIVVGALVGLVLAYAPRRNRNTVQVVGITRSDHALSGRCCREVDDRLTKQAWTRELFARIARAAQNSMCACDTEGTCRGCSGG